MAQILILPNAPQLNTGNQTLTPVQYKIYDTGMGQALQNVGKSLLDVKTNLVDKTKNLDDMTTLLNQSDAFEKEDLNIEKYKQANLDKPDTWEDYAKDRAANLYANHNIEPPTDPEARLKFDSKFNNWSNNLASSTFASSIKTKSSNFMSSLDAEKSRAYQTGDFTTLNTVIDQGHAKGIFSGDQANALREDSNNLFRKRRLDDVNNHVQMYVGSRQYDAARNEIDMAHKNGLMSDSEKEAQISRIDHQYDYNNKLDGVDAAIQDNPSKVVESLQIP